MLILTATYFLNSYVKHYGQRDEPLATASNLSIPIPINTFLTAFSADISIGAVHASSLRQFTRDRSPLGPILHRHCD